MRKSIRATAATALAAALLSAACPIAASAAAPIVGIDDLFSAPSYSMDQGERIELRNDGLNRHNVVSFQIAPSGFTPLFESPLISRGTATVSGTEYLKTGSYPFLCTLHSLMRATLEVGPGGAPLPRPKVQIRIPSQSDERLAQSGRLRLLLSSRTNAGPTTVLAGSAGKPLTITVAAGRARPATIELARSFRRKLASGSKVRLKIKAVPHFGLATTKSKVLQ